MKHDTESIGSTEDYDRIEQVIRFWESNAKRQPPPVEIAAAVGLDTDRLHQLFERWAGVAPERFLRHLTTGYARNLLRQSPALLGAGLAAERNRRQDDAITVAAITAEERQKMGSTLRITYGFHPTPFGTCLLAIAPKGICALRFIAPHEKTAMLNQLQGEWPKSTFDASPTITQNLIREIFSRNSQGASFQVLLTGTRFQVLVWRALLAIPAGALASYQDIASFLGMPRATRAVAGAIAHNPVAYLLPCHRIIRKTGEIHEYRWGATRKKAMIGWEAALFSSTVRMGVAQR